MHLVSVNVGKARDHLNGQRVERTGIYKMPSADPVYVGTLGLAGDDVVDTENHGGVDQAVYLYGRADYDWWEDQIGRALPGGMFGENLTIAGLACQQFKIGDRLQVGAVLLEVTAPRIPCSTFATKMDDPEWVKKFRQAERPGLYCRVIQTGAVAAGDSVTYTPYTRATVTLVEMYRAWYERKTLDEAAIRALLAAPIDVRSRREFEGLLEKRMA
jgi:MOSC domain-containing protein YiiM